MAVKTKNKNLGTKLIRAQKKIVPVGHEFTHLKGLFYGDNGSGKTSLSTTLGKTLIVDCNEKGTDSILGSGADKFNVDLWADIDLAYWYAYHGDHDYEVFVIDTLTSLSWLCMKFVLGDQLSRDPTRSPHMPKIQDYGGVGELLGTQIIQWRNLPYHIIFLAQERVLFNDDEEDEGEGPKYGPDLGRKSQSVVKSAVSIIGRTTTREVVVKKGGKKVRETEYLLHLGRNNTFATKVRRPRNAPPVPRVIRDPDLGRLVAFMQKGVESGRQENGQ